MMSDSPLDPLRGPWRVEFPGLMPYEAGMELMRLRHQQRRAGTIPDTLLLLEHHPVVTLGIRAQASEELHWTAEKLEGGGVTVARTDRGGLATLHAPGQLVGYLICHLPEGLRGLGSFLRALEGWLVRSIEPYGLTVQTNARHPGIYMQGDAPGAPLRKLASLGLALQGGVTLHGFALNISNDLGLFHAIRPCGLDRVEMVRMADLMPSDRPAPTLPAMMQTLIDCLPSPPEPAAEPAPLGTLRRLAYAWNRRDVPGAVECFALDGRFEAPGQQPLVGRHVLASHWAPFFGALELIRFETGEPAAAAPLASGTTHNAAAPGQWLVPYTFAYAKRQRPGIRCTRGTALVEFDAQSAITLWREFWPLDLLTR